MKHVLFFLLPALFNVCSAQFPDYYVYLVKGTVNVSKANAKPQPVKQSGFLYNNDVLNITKNAEITLVNKNAEYAVINTPGNVKVSSLSKKISASYTGVTKKYLNLVWEQVLDPDYDFTKFKEKNLTGVYGGVQRGESCNNLIFPVNGLKTSADSIVFKWQQTSPSSNYNFFIYDNEWNESAKISVKDTQLSVNTTQLLSKKGKYFWLIKSDDGSCEDEIPLYFELLDKEQENKLIASLLPAGKNDSLTTELETIDKLEKNALVYAVKNQYINLINKYPDNKALLQMYIMFLLNYGFDDEARNAWKGGKN